MNTKNLLVSFLTILAVVAVIATVSATTDELVKPDTTLVMVDGTYVLEGDYTGSTISVVAGESISISVRFTSNVYDSDVTVEADLEGEKVDVRAVSSPFNVEKDSRYKKTLSLRVPYELKDELSNDDLELNIKIDGRDYRTNLDPIYLKVQRPSYNVAIKSVSVSQSVEAGETFPVDIVLKNIGYNDLDDLYVTVSVPEIGIQKSGYFGDLVALECDDNDGNLENYGIDDESTFYRKCNEDDDETVSERLFLDVPYGVMSGAYTLEVSVKNDDTTSNKAVQLIVENDFEDTVFKSGNSLWIVNPTDNVMGYRIVVESPASVSDSVVFVQAGSSETISVNPNTEGEYTFNVNVFSMKGDLIDTLTFSGNADADTDNSETNPIVILTVILAIIFIVLLIVLIVLIGKKPEKSGEFGESYY